MSWEAYVDGQLLGTGTVSHGAILGLDGAVWAAKSTAGAWALTEGPAFAALFASECRGQNVTVGGDSYMVVNQSQDAPPTIYLKKGSSGGASMKCNKCIVLGVYRNPEQGDPTYQAGKCNTAVGKLADYLIENEY